MEASARRLEEVWDRYRCVACGDLRLARFAGEPVLTHCPCCTTREGGGRVLEHLAVLRPLHTVMAIPAVVARWVRDATWGLSIDSKVRLHLRLAEMFEQLAAEEHEEHCARQLLDVAARVRARHVELRGA